MEGDERNYQPIEVNLIGCETGRQRFPTNTIFDEEAPILSTWRNNLTALSQHWNLYFLASRDRILVYNPKYPTQALGKKAKVILKPQLPNPTAGGYIDREHPHSINHVIVGNLGTEEILLLATDSGNVCAYLVKHIQRAIENGTPKLFEGEVDDGGVNPFFSQWVEMSAWGLAIHEAARMIAVSANTAEITVFAFALAQAKEVDDENDSMSDDEETASAGLYEGQWGAWLEYSPFDSSADLDAARRRLTNLKIVLRGHETNIPNINFLASEDLDSCWLVSTDINCRLKIWDIWKGQCIRTTGFRRSDEHYFWYPIALDPGSFRLASTGEELCGLKKARRVHDYLDITQNPGALPGSSAFHPAFGNLDPSSLGHVMSDDDFDDDDEAGIFLDEQDLEMEEETDDDDDDDGVAIGSPSAAFSPEVPAPQTFNAAAPSLDPTASILQQNTLSNAVFGYYFTHQPTASKSFSPSSTSSPNPPNITTTATVPQVPILHASDRHIRLLANPLARPHVFCGRVLAQHLPPSLEHFRHWDRMNLVAYIPELGVVVLGSQVGRVAVVVLTRWKSGLTCFRHDWILPSEAEEREGRRPKSPLAGLAVAPVQGYESRCSGSPREGDEGEEEEGGEEEGVAESGQPAGLGASGSKSTGRWCGVEGARRYRLMLTYLDSTVLTYELTWGTQHLGTPGNKHWRDVMLF